MTSLSRFRAGGENLTRMFFENNGRDGNAIVEHPSFVSYLRYFMDGPALPVSTIDGFRTILIEGVWTSGGC